MRLSIIVPVYKTQSILDKCIESIICQTYKDLQIILIDDGSPDKSSEICDNNQNIDSRIIVIHQNNIGVSGARNAGLDIVNGQYIGFVDSDDYLQFDYYKKLVDLIYQRKNSIIDIICCGYTYEYPFQIFKKYLYPTFEDGESLNNEMIINKLLPAFFWEDINITKTLYSVWNKLIHRSFFEEKKIRFPLEWNHAEDANVSIQCFCYANNVLFSHLCGYHYVCALNTLSLSRRIRLDFFLLEIRFRYFLLSIIGSKIHQNYKNKRGYCSIIQKANNCIVNIFLNEKNQYTQKKWLLYIFNNQDYRMAILNIENNFLDDKTKQYKNFLINNDFNNWYRFVKNKMSSRYNKKVVILFDKMIKFISNIKI